MDFCSFKPHNQIGYIANDPPFSAIDMGRNES